MKAGSTCACGLWVGQEWLSVLGTWAEQGGAGQGLAALIAKRPLHLCPEVGPTRRPTAGSHLPYDLAMALLVLPLTFLTTERAPRS